MLANCAYFSTRSEVKCYKLQKNNNIYNANDEDDNINPPTIANSCNGNAKLAHHLKRPTEPSWQIEMGT